MPAAASGLLRRGAAGALAILLAGAAIALSQPLAAAADPVVVQPGELVINGDAEQAASVGWTGTLGQADYGVSSYPNAVIVDATGATGATFSGGVSMFTGANTSATSASQTIDLTASAAAIDNGHVDALLSAYVGGFSGQDDNATVTYTFRDVANATVASVVFGPVFAADRGSISGFKSHSQTQMLPPGTRSVQVTLEMRRFVITANDGYVDNVSLILDAPSPVATTDSVNTTQGAAVTFSPFTNDIPGAGAAIIPSSVRILDGTTLVTSLTTAAGTYTVDPATGNIEFVPNPGFTGTAAAVPYRVTDSSGQTGDGVFSVTVAAAGAALAVTGTDVLPWSLFSGALLLGGLGLLGFARKRRRLN